MPRAIPCTATCDPRYGRGRCGAFGPVGVRARKLRGLDGIIWSAIKFNIHIVFVDLFSTDLFHFFK